MVSVYDILPEVIVSLGHKVLVYGILPIRSLYLWVTPLRSILSSPSKSISEYLLKLLLSKISAPGWSHTAPFQNIVLRKDKIEGSTDNKDCMMVNLALEWFLHPPLVSTYPTRLTAATQISVYLVKYLFLRFLC
jgi:hypothetical protein